MMKKIGTWAMICWLFWTCQNGSEKSHNQLIVNELNFEKLKFGLQNEPGKKGTVIHHLSKGESLRDLGEVSPFVTSIREADSVFHAPWLRVETTTGQRGWVFAGWLSHKYEDPILWQKHKLLDAFLGHELALRVANWSKSLENIVSDRDFQQQFEAGMTLRDAVSAALHVRTASGEETLPESYFLIADVMPGFVMQRVSEEENVPFLFADFHFFEKIAQKSAGSEDDFFVRICQQAYPIDSIESFYPFWVIPIEHHKVHRLGSGESMQFLQNLHENGFQKRLFAPQLAHFVEHWVNDLTHPPRFFWYRQEQVSGELQQILAQNFTLFTERDRLALQKLLDDVLQNRTAHFQFDVRGLGLR